MMKDVRKRNAENKKYRNVKMFASNYLQNIVEKKLKNFTKISQLTFITRRKVKYIILDK